MSIQVMDTNSEGAESMQSEQWSRRENHSKVGNSFLFLWFRFSGFPHWSQTVCCCCCTLLFVVGKWALIILMLKVRKLQSNKKISLWTEEYFAYVGCSPRFSAWVIGEIVSLQPGQIPVTAWVTVDSPSAWPWKSTSIINQTGNNAVSPATPRPMQCQEFRFGWICKQLQNDCRNSHNWGSIARHIFRLSSALVTRSWALDTVLQDFSNCGE